MLRNALFILFVLTIINCTHEIESSKSYHLNRSCDLTYITCDSIQIQIPDSYGLFDELPIETIQRYKDRYLYYQSKLFSFDAFSNQRNIFIDLQNLHTCFYVFEVDEIPFTKEQLDQSEDKFNRFIPAPDYELIEKKLDKKKGMSYMQLQYIFKRKEENYFSFYTIETEIGFFQAISYSIDLNENILNNLSSIKKK